MLAWLMSVGAVLTPLCVEVMEGHRDTYRDGGYHVSFRSAPWGMVIQGTDRDGFIEHQLYLTTDGSQPRIPELSAMFYHGKCILSEDIAIDQWGHALNVYKVKHTKRTKT